MDPPEVLEDGVLEGPVRGVVIEVEGGGFGWSVCEAQKAETWSTDCVCISAAWLSVNDMTSHDLRLSKESGASIKSLHGQGNYETGMDCLMWMGGSGW